MIELLVFTLGAASGAAALLLAFRLTYRRDPDEAVIEAVRIDTIIFGMGAMFRRPDGGLERLDPNQVELRVLR